MYSITKCEVCHLPIKCIRFIHNQPQVKHCVKECGLSRFDCHVHRSNPTVNWSYCDECISTMAH